MRLVLRSPAFTHKGSIPKRYTCEGDDVSPPLSWTCVPQRAKSLALIVDDRDAPEPAKPRRPWVHWVLYNIPASVPKLDENCGAHGGIPEALDGANDAGHTGYHGPCPPTGRHRYFHKLLALDTVLPDLRRPNKARLFAALMGHVLAEATLIGTYQKGTQTLHKTLNATQESSRQGAPGTPGRQREQRNPLTNGRTAVLRSQRSPPSSTILPMGPASV